MLGYIIKTIILTIFIIIIIHFTIEHTKNIWYIPKHIDYEPSYKKIVDLLDNLPYTEDPPSDSMENKLNEYINNMT